MDRLTREAEAERAPGDPMKVGSPRQARPFLAMACAALIAAAIVLGIMWFNNTRDHGHEPPTPALQRQ